MKNKLFAVGIVLFIFLPVSYVFVREMLVRINGVKQVKERPAMKPFSATVKIHDSTVNGFILLAPYELYKWRDGELIIVDMNGKVWLDKHINGTVYDFRQWNLNGKVYYSYQRNDSGVYHIKKISLTAGHVVLLDSMLNEIKHIHLLPFDDVAITGHKDLDLHDLILFSPDHYITVAAYEKEVTNIPDSLHPVAKVRVAAPVIQEVLNDKVIWQWDGSKYPELYSCGDIFNHYNDTTKTQDYLHINSCNIDPADSNLVVSFRSANMVIKISRKDGHIMWKLGGRHSDFALKDDQRFLRQHHATFTSDTHTLMLMDNGDSVLRQTSRVLEFGLDEQSKTITTFKAWNIPQAYSQHMGSVAVTGNYQFIGGGSSPYVMLTDRAGRKLFEMQTSHPSYRAYWVKDIYGLKQ